MATKRTIKVLSSKTNEKVTLSTNVTTWGELKQLLSEKDVYENGMNAVVSPSKVILSLDDAQLPEGDFKIVLSQTKMKAGLYSEAKLKELRTKFNKLMDAVRSSRSSSIDQKKAAEVSGMINNTLNELIDDEEVAPVKKAAKKVVSDPDFDELEELAGEL